LLGYNVAQEQSMPANAVVRARIDEKTKKKATRVLKSMGLTPSSAFRLLMVRVAAEQNLPFELRTPNAETAAAIEEARRGGLKSFNSVEELMTDLNTDD
jgi:DNA-damage-inducible protein J